MDMFNESQDRYEASWEYHGPAIEFNKQIVLAMTEKEMPDLIIVAISLICRTTFTKNSWRNISSYVRETGEVEKSLTRLPSSLWNTKGNSMDCLSAQTRLR